MVHLGSKMNEKEYTMFTMNAPIVGLEEDLSSFLDEFVSNGSPRFSSFAVIWRQKQFIHMIYGRQTQRGLTDILEGIFYYLMNIISNNNSSNLLKIGSLYSMYAFFGKQPVLQQARINVTIETWSALVRLSENLLQEKQWDAYYIFRQLCVMSAFNFCASSQNLYPGAPLYTRSDVVLPISADFLAKKDRRKGLNAKSLQSLSPSLSVPTHIVELPEYLQNNWPAIDVAINRYHEAKMELNRYQPNTEPTTSTASTSNELDEMMLGGLSLVKYPESLQSISELMEQFTTSTSKSAINDGQLTNSEQTNGAIRQPIHEEEIGKRRKHLREAKSWSKAPNQSTNRIWAKGHRIKQDRSTNLKFLASDGKL